MIKNILAASFMSAILLFSGCSSTSSEGESRLEVQQLLDSGDYSAVIALLEPTDSTTTDEEYLALASAYMGQSGFGFSDIVSLMTTSNSTGGSGFASFSSSIAAGKSATALSDLGKAMNNYKKVVPDCNVATLSASAQDVCLFVGLSSMVKTATTLSYLGDLSNFGGGVSNNELNASVIAMKYAFDGNNTLGYVDTTASVVTFTSTNTYKPLAVTVNTVPYYYLMTPTVAGGAQTIITDGNCTQDFTACATANNTDCYACPVNRSSNPLDELTVATILVDILNNGLDAIIGAVGADANSTIAADIEQYKLEITGSTTGTVTVQNIIDYINLQN